MAELLFCAPPFFSEPKKRLCKVLFEYQPVNEDELELKIGDIVDITEEVLHSLFNVDSTVTVFFWNAIFWDLPNIPVIVGLETSFWFVLCSLFWWDVPSI